MASELVARPLPLPRSSFTPKLLSYLAAGYGCSDLRADLLAGLTVAVVALPLSMAIAIASGLSPDKGLMTAVVGGALVSLLGGSRYQIGGPAGAFIVVVAQTHARFGWDGLVLATALSGLLLVMAGVARLGGLIRHMPHAVIVAFTGAIAVLIGTSQIGDLLGLHLSSREPSGLISKLVMLAEAAGSANPAAVVVASLSIILILFVRRMSPKAPALLIALAITSALVSIGHLSVDTVGTRFPTLARTFPGPRLPAVSMKTLAALLPTAASFALLGSIESLLSATVADRMVRTRHRPNCELVAQGFANIASAALGGFCVTGTIARTATNVRAGARRPLAGVFQACLVLAFMLIGMRAMALVPLPALAGLLLIVAYGLVDWRELAIILRGKRTTALTTVTTFVVVIVWGLGLGIFAGCIISAALHAVGNYRSKARIEAQPAPDCLHDPSAPVRCARER
jgi:SulP family sulfate permease